MASRWWLPRTGWGLLFIVVPLLFGLIALWFGKDVNWDFRNYHYYNPYAFLHDRMGFDIAPAMLQNYLNPFIDVPFYLMMVSFPAWVVVFTLGTLQGINFSLVFAITWRIAQGLVGYKRILLSLCSAGLGCLAPGFILELGATNHDSTLSILVLIAILLLVTALQRIDADDDRRVFLLVGLAGFVMGAAVGLKLTNGIYAVGSAIGLFLVMPTWPRRLKVLLIYGCLGVAAVLLIAGPWMWQMWDQFQNPFFPMFNHVFQSEEIAPVALKKPFKPQGLLEIVGWPVVFSFNPERLGAGYSAKDIRFVVVWLTSLLCLIAALIRLVVKAAAPPREEGRCFERRSRVFMIVFFWASFIVWMIMFSSYRKIIAIELLVPLVFFILLEMLGLARRVQVGLGIVGLLVILAYFRPIIPREKSPDWSERYIEVDTRFLTNPEATAVIMLGNAPMGYLIPAFPPGVRFLRPEGNLRLRGNDGMMLRITEAIAGHEGPLYVMYVTSNRRVNLEKSADRFKLNIDAGQCITLKKNVAKQTVLCPATRR